MSEHDEQKALFQWAAWLTPRVPALRLLHAIPNGGARHPAVAAKLKAEGLSAKRGWIMKKLPSAPMGRLQNGAIAFLTQGTLRADGSADYGRDAHLEALWRAGQPKETMMQPYYQDALVTLYHGRCEDVMPTLEAQSFDAVICDVPYGQTACAWDAVIPFDVMWTQIKRLVKPRAAVVLFGSEPFSSLLRVSNLDWYKYDWVWKKTRSVDFFNNKNKPRNIHEVISVFSAGTTANASPNRMPYFPQGLQRVNRRWHRPNASMSDHRTTRPSHSLDRVIEYDNYPETVIEFSNPNQGSLHPTQKPLALMEYLVKTYTNEGDSVLDFTSGSGTTLRACKNLGRRCVGIEMLEGYCAATVKRLAPAFEEAMVDTTTDFADLPLFAPTDADDARQAAA